MKEQINKEIRSKTFRFRCTESEAAHIHSVCVSLNSSLIDLIFKAYRKEFNSVPIDNTISVKARRPKKANMLNKNTEYFSSDPQGKDL